MKEVIKRLIGNGEETIDNAEELILKLYDKLNYSQDWEDIEHDIDIMYLTCNESDDGRTWFWYLDNEKSVAIDVATGEIVDDEEELNKLFGIVKE